ncbi:unnamed protein product [Soboliphyme baturini]|uniref:non-specific serine/threonine protein kinase n=1 Tax=Soboliphyme baturini TaxID=241478 RepID=A0A183IXI6_9BILA|nr:unnamed protein product [Soboliphyme baturini]
MRGALSPYIPRIEIESRFSRTHRLALEAEVLKKLQNRPHVLQFIDNGVSNNVCFLVMQMAGRNLTTLKRKCSRQHFTLCTVVLLGIQCIESVRQVHEVGYIHRDVKPRNFVVGIEEHDRRIVYILDFGLARRFRQEDGIMCQPRPKAKFRGTTRYASPNAHQGKELGRHDDLWSILYSLVDMYKGDLPWRTVKKEVVGEIKNNIKPEQLFDDMPKQFYEIWNKLKAASYADQPDYDWYTQQMRDIMKANDYEENASFDWELIRPCSFSSLTRFKRSTSLFKKAMSAIMCKVRARKNSQMKKANLMN